MAIKQICLYFDDLEVDQEYESAARTILESDILAFAGFCGDFNPIHIDHEYCKNTPFRKPIAHGFGVFCIASGLSTNAPLTHTVALLGVRDWKFTAPVYPGDTVRMISRVVEKVARGRGKHGEIIWHRRIENQHGKIVQEGHLTTMVKCRPVEKTVKEG